MTIPIVVLGLAVLAIRTWFQRRRLAGAKLDEPMSNRENALSADALQRLAAWSDAVETDELRTPSDVHDPQAWDRYWRKQIDVGTIEQGFNDMMSSDPNLIALLKRRGVRKILCAGVGLSSEPLALALHGFEVTALDISDIPRAAIAVNIGNGTHPLGRIPGLTLKEDGSTIRDRGRQRHRSGVVPAYPPIRRSPPRWRYSLIRYWGLDRLGDLPRSIRRGDRTPNLTALPRGRTASSAREACGAAWSSRVSPAALCGRLAAGQ